MSQTTSAKTTHINDPKWLAKKAFDLYTTHGVPIEISEDIVEKHGLLIDTLELDRLITEHQTLSQNSSAGQFKSGLGSNSEMAKSMHTATHILHTVLRKMFGNKLQQMGSAILDDKARFDINIAASEISDEKVKEIEEKVNEVINKGLIMEKLETTETAARELGAIGLFGEKYGEKVTVYTLKDAAGTVFSREFCGGPHIKNTAEIKPFKILKKKSIGAGLTRVEFVCE
jgi:alanyl-tRNA synthetase